MGFNSGFKGLMVSLKEELSQQTVGSVWESAENLNNKNTSQIPNISGRSQALLLCTEL